MCQLLKESNPSSCGLAAVRAGTATASSEKPLRHRRAEERNKVWKECVEERADGVSEALS